MKDVVMLSAYPAGKVILACDKCGLNVQYDKAAMLAAGGDRALPELRLEIARRKGCTKVDSIYAFDQCRIKYANIMTGQNAYAKAKGS